MNFRWTVIHGVLAKVKIDIGQFILETIFWSQSCEKTFVIKVESGYKYDHGGAIIPAK